jgi:hypothetical protein
MAKFKLTIVVDTTEDFDPKDFTLQESDVIDGFELSRNDELGDVTSEFHLKHAYITNVEPIK